MHFNINAQSSQTTSRGHKVNNFTGKEMNPEHKQEPADCVISALAIKWQRRVVAHPGV